MNIEHPPLKSARETVPIPQTVPAASQTTIPASQTSPARTALPISPDELSRQTAFQTRIYHMFQTREAHPSAYVHTFGCQQNVADGQTLMGMLREMGFSFTSVPEDADFVILNTCAVREHAEDRVFGHLGALTHSRRANPEQVIAVCGCMAQEERVRRKIRESYPHVDLVFGPQSLWKFPELLWRVYDSRERVFAAPDEAGRIAEGLPVERGKSVRAWVPVMYGCDNFCSYCIVPYARGRERSRTPEAVVEEVRTLVDAGCKEINLLGQNVNSYGKGSGCDFSALLRRVDQIPGDYWIRFISSHPKDASARLFDTMANGVHIVRQIHLPFQSGSDRVLRAMNRHYTRAKYLELVRYARSVMPDLVLTSDVIIGFPGETEAEAMETVSLVEEVGFDALFTFLYSPRPGTKAAELPDPVPRTEKLRWFDKLLAVQNAHSAAIHAAYTGKHIRVLVDGKNRDETDTEYPLTARTAGNRLVRLKGEESLFGHFADVTVTGNNTWALYAEAD